MCTTINLHDRMYCLASRKQTFFSMHFVLEIPLKYASGGGGGGSGEVGEPWSHTHTHAPRTFPKHCNIIISNIVWGAGFCTWMVQYIWVVIIISNAFWFNGNGWFKIFVTTSPPGLLQPYHLLHPFMQPIMPTTILAQKKNNILRLFGRGLSLEPEAPATWATSRKANKTWKNKKKLKLNKKW